MSLAWVSPLGVGWQIVGMDWMPAGAQQGGARGLPDRAGRAGNIGGAKQQNGAGGALLAGAGGRDR